MLLADPNPLHWQVRIAAHNVIAADHRKRQPKGKGS